ncbi:MAG: rane fusion protein multidrug efflux system [Verrucomicrobiota bacterium]
MHDVVKPSTPEREQKVARRKLRSWISVVGAVLFLIVVVVALKALGAAILILLIVVATLLAILFGLTAVNRFRSRRTTAGALFAVLCLFLTLVDVKLLQFFKMNSSPMVMPATTVTSAVAKEEDWAPALSSVGTISAVQGAVVSSELGGTVAEVKFQNGGVAKKGDILVRLAATSEDADLELARSDLMRTRDLAARKVISKAELDAAESKLKQKEGAVEKREVRAPFDGQLGIRQVNVGQMINAGQQVVSLQALDPLFVDFAVPQQNVPNLVQGLEARVRTDALGDRVFVGKVTAINSSVDTATRNVSVQVTLDNHDHALKPGMFAKIEIILPTKQKTLVVPGTAVSYAPYGDSVYVIETKKDEKTGKESQTIRQAFVRLGEARGDFVSITKGLKAGETVVGTGVFKLRNGMAVTINNELAPKPELNPTPTDS